MRNEITDTKYWVVQNGTMSQTGGKMNGFWLKYRLALKAQSYPIFLEVFRGGGGSAQKSEADNSQDYFCTTEMTKRELLPEFDCCRDVTNDAYTRSTTLYALRCAGDVSLLYPALLAELCASISSFLSCTLSLSSAASRQLLVLKSA